MRLILITALCTLLHAPLRAETTLLPEIDFDDGLDAGAARAAMLRGEILPLDQLLAIVRKAFPGEIIGIELELEDSRLVYEFEILDHEGRLYEIEVEAASGRILEVEAGDDDD